MALNNSNRVGFLISYGATYTLLVAKISFEVEMIDGEIISDPEGTISENWNDYRVHIYLDGVSTIDTSGTDRTWYLLNTWLPSKDKVIKLDRADGGWDPIRVALANPKQKIDPAGNSQVVGALSLHLIQKSTGDLPDYIPPGGD
jgi:hypothetical protein